ncbi:MAG: hypothetical protein QXI19_05900 [Candidatus Caldarchaeum sp.]|jgi:hypothetical protein
MKKFLIPLATAITALLPHQNFAATIDPAKNVSPPVATWIEPKTSLHLLDAVVAEPVATLVITKTPVSIERISHRSHRSHASHRSHRSGR